MKIRQIIGALLFLATVTRVVGDEAADRVQAQKLQADGNFKEAYAGFLKLVTDPRSDAAQAPDDLTRGFDCLERLGEQGQMDGFLEQAVRAHGNNWRLLQQAAVLLMNQVPHGGMLVGGEFQRGNPRGDIGGRWVQTEERDRVRALQLMAQALPLVQAHRPPAETYFFYRSYAGLVLGQRGYGDAWRLQMLTDLERLPDYDEPQNRDGSGGAPVDAEGQPVYYAVPESFEKAANDGERWRWLLRQAELASPANAGEARFAFARFLQEQFDVQTMAACGPWFRADSGDDEQAGIYAVQTLKDEETIARLATGVKRFTLPPEFRFIALLKDLADKEGANSGPKRDATQMLATIYENRRQYPEAVTWWERYAAFDKKAAQERIQQITGNWGQFEPVRSQPAGQPATVPFRFRNAPRISFTAYRVDLPRLVNDVRAYLRGRPEQLDGEKLNLYDIGQRLVWENQQQYLTGKAAEWELKLEPKPNHLDRRIVVTTPLKEAGAYLLVGQLPGGNTSRIVVVLDATVIVRKQLDKKHLLLTVDAVTGQPLPNVKVELFGYRQEWIEKTNKNRTVTTEASAQTNADGLLFLTPEQAPEDFQWLITASGADGRFAYDGFIGIGYPERFDSDYEATKSFVITDRPVYRPGQKVQWKAWVAYAKYDMDDQSAFAGRPLQITINNPSGEAVFEQALTADAYGGVNSELPLADECPLGGYSLLVQVDGNVVGGGAFQVEEYKKPEFEVTVKAPVEPVALGEKIEAKVEAKYYFGAPVTKATAKIKVLRYEHRTSWYPAMPWDWFYGPGYGWFAYDYDWYPGWQRWGCQRPPIWWMPAPGGPPEIVADVEMPISADGTATVTIDTALAKETMGDRDHRYEITAEVVDESRRTIVGTGTVIAAREPFKVYAWVDRGHYAVGDTVLASFQARTPDGKGVAGNGRLRLLRLTYDAARAPVEKEVQAWDLATDDQGCATQKLTAASAGQFRLAYTVTDAKGHALEGGYVFAVRGEGAKPGDFRFSHIELVPDKAEYRPGERMELAIRADREDAFVLLFVRAANGICQMPKIIRLKGRSAIEEINITQQDMPNFFIEAITVADGEVHTAIKEIVVPPEKRVLGVEVLPSATRFPPGAKGLVRVKLTETSGKPFVGTLVVSVYDKSVEYVAGGSNVGDIRAHFWQWRRQHNESTWDTLARWFNNLLKPLETPMQTVGLFGDASEGDEQGGGMAFGGGGKGRGGMMRASRMARGMAGGGMAMDAMTLTAAVPMAAMAPGAPGPAGMAMDKAVAGEAAGFGGGGMGGPLGGAAPELVQPVVRQEFADTAVWVSTLETAADGTAEVPLPLPENLTTWKIRVWAMGKGSRVGEGSAEVITSKNLLLRLQAPRFFVQKDEVVLSANVHNYLETDKEVRAVLELDGPCLEVDGEPERQIHIAAKGEARVDWRVKVVQEGEAVVRMKALSDAESDAMEMRFPVYVHGMDKMVSSCGLLRPQDTTAEIKIEVPKQRRPESARLELRFSPSLALAMIDALPYLVEYPYGCTEQTLNRFLPTVVTQNVLQRMGISLKDIRDKRANLNAQELGDPAQRATQWQRYGIPPVYDEKVVADMVHDGVATLVAMQLSDGGWGWFSGWGEHSSPHTTATVVHGLQVAVENDLAVAPEVLQRGVEWLRRYQSEQVRLLRNAEQDPRPEAWKGKADHTDALVYRVLGDADVVDEAMRDYLYRDRTELSIYGLALYGLALQRQKQEEKLGMVLRNLAQFVVRDEENQTAYLNLGNSNPWWTWYGSEIEAQATYLKLLCAADPRNDLLPRLVKYLLNNRKHGTYWNSTRDTALCVEAFADYIKAAGEDRPEMTVTLSLDGKALKKVDIKPENLFTIDTTFVLEGERLETGAHTLVLTKEGKGPLYWNCYVSTFTLEDPITKAGLEVKSERTLYRLLREDGAVAAAGAAGQVVRQRVEHYRREPLASGARVESGDLIEVELVVESKNDYEYIVLEDFKAAGCEPVDLRSGYTGNEMGAYVEFRDERTAFFMRQLARGKHSVSYRLRAEVPGTFSALPAKIRGMYAPELRGNSDETKLEIGDRK
jgi:uncharacterized protein YfaS (alpha-2-macroglobulin family)